MAGKKAIFSILLLFLITISCKNEPVMHDDLWVGTIRVLDHNIPFPFLLERTEEGLNLINYKNDVINITTEHIDQYEPMDTIKMRDHQFLVLKTSPHLLLFDIRDSLRFPIKNPLYAAQFVNSEPSKRIDISALRQKLEENIFQTEVASAHFATPNRDLKVLKTMDFSEDSLKTIYSYYYNDTLVYTEKEEAKIYLFERKDRVFFTKDQVPEKPEILY